jgi:hypothetical protein
VEGLLETMGVSVDLEIGGGTAFATPVPNLPEFKICNAQGACQREMGKARHRPRHKITMYVNTFFT